MIIATDTSALIAIINAEEEAGAFVDALGSCTEAQISAATLLEAHCVATVHGTVSMSMPFTH